MFFGVNIRPGGNGRKRLWLCSPIEHEQTAPFRFDLLHGSHLMKVIDGIALFNRWMTVLLAYVDKHMLRYFAIIDVASESTRSWKLARNSFSFKEEGVSKFRKTVHRKSETVSFKSTIFASHNRTKNWTKTLSSHRRNDKVWRLMKRSIPSFSLFYQLRSKLGPKLWNNESTKMEILLKTGKYQTLSQTSDPKIPKHVIHAPYPFLLFSNETPLLARRFLSLKW